MKRRTIVASMLGGLGWTAHGQERQNIVVFAAGSLRGALTEVANAFERVEPRAQVRFTFGASGLLRDQIAGGASADVFASANMDHPRSLALDVKTSPVRRFAGNALCALVSARTTVTSETLIDTLLDPRVRLGTSTPKADPSGDYAWMLFERIEHQGNANAFAILSKKARQLTGGTNSSPPPTGRNVYGALVADGQADVFITYCTAATAAVAEQPALRIVSVPSAINVSADYGVVTLAGASPLADRFVAYLLGPIGQAVLLRQGFTPA